MLKLCFALWQHPAPASFFNISSRVRQSSHENGDAHWAFFSKGVFIPFRLGGRLQYHLHTKSPSRTYVPDKNVLSCTEV